MIRNCNTAKKRKRSLSKTKAISKANYLLDSKTFILCTMNSDPRAVQEGLHSTKSDGTLHESFNAKTGKWEGPAVKKSERQSLAFDRTTGKLCLGPEATHPDNTLAIPMAQAGFFMN